MLLILKIATGWIIGHFSVLGIKEFYNRASEFKWRDTHTINIYTEGDPYFPKEYMAHHFYCSFWWRIKPNQSKRIYLFKKMDYTVRQFAKIGEWDMNQKPVNVRT